MKKTILFFVCAFSASNAQAEIHIQACVATLPNGTQVMVRGAEDYASFLLKKWFERDAVWTDCADHGAPHNFRIQFLKKTPKKLPEERRQDIAFLRGTIITVRFDFLKYLVGKDEFAEENLLGAVIATIIGERMNSIHFVNSWSMAAINSIKNRGFEGIGTGVTVGVKDLR